ncbi:C4-dicarboxylate transporter DctQ subunit [Planktotalea frisia]|jgi:C4-dicarboxylate transporter DctQ subunit|uniref:TRAP transporter small permease protein n=1 Tax=Planktotalea frisia TaxID=696762 RepID=A0A1L9NYI6_9RHOB|nr:TRAP transporter small permease subunit [Planktotalea frisia]OJI94329.1 tripartite ATP-independent periplasmic transporter, DctQ component [Planktotalea frisia]PZX30244.1 C4-dicarboxylate transporter DctQ subunit [Planktotalea frisia]
MKRVFKGLSRLAEIIAGGMLAAIFVTFLLQIGSRYTPRIIANFGLAETFPTLAAIAPLGWTLELIGILWVWVIFFSCAFIVREHEHVRFDIIYLSVSTRVRRIFALVSAAAIVIGMLYSFLPTWDYIDFMRMRRTATVRNPFDGAKIPLRTIFSVYAIFMAAVAARYAWLMVDVWRNGPPKTELEIALEADGKSGETL